MKKVLSCTLATAIASSPMTAFATNNVEVQSNEETKTESISRNKVTGNIELDINFLTPIIDSDKNDISIKLNQGDTNHGSINLSQEASGTINNGSASYSIEKLNSKREVLDSNDKEIYFIRVIFKNLERGNYSLELSGSGYSTANIEDIDITNYSKRIRVGTANNVVKVKGSDGNEKEEVYKGAFLAGDVNSDNIISMDDYNLVLEETLKFNHNKSYDIDKDGKVNIADLTNIKGNIGKSKVTLNSSDYENTDAIIDPENVNIEVSEDINVEGDIKDILTDSNNTVAIGNVDSAPSAEKPISIKLDLTNQSARSNSPVDMEKIVIKSPTTSSNENAGAPESGIIKYIDANGKEGKVEFNSSTNRTKSSGTEDIVIDLGKQIAVKEITIDVTSNRGNKNISEIAKIEFLNNVYKEIPKPDMSIPQIRTVETSTDLHDERITLTWEPQANVTGYEVKYQKLDENNKVQWTKTLQTNKTELNILDKAIKPYDLFRVSIQSLNGDWKSGYANELTDEDKGYIGNPFDGKADNVDENYNPIDGYYGVNNAPKDKGTISEIRVVPLGAPSEPLNLSITSGYKSFSVSWEEHKRARDFDIYYRKVGETGKSWKKANDNNKLVEENSQAMTNPDKNKLVRSHNYTVKGLEDEATYEVRVTATNHFGTSKMSETYLATTQSMKPPVTTNYKLINRPTSENEIGTTSIIDVENSTHGTVSVDSKYAAVDGDYSTIYTVKDWDAGASYRNYRGPIVTFDKEYTIGEIAVITSLEMGSFNTSGARVFVWDEAGNKTEITPKVTQKKSNDKNYAILTFNEPAKVKKIQVNTHVYSTGHVSISELKFYEYDSLEQEVKDLFKDDLRLELKETVTQTDIDRLVKKAKTMDPVSKEYHPNLRSILGKNSDPDPKYHELGDNTQLGIAQKLLEEANISKKITKLDGTIGSRHGGQKLGMSNDWQSLGAVARPGKNEDNEAKEITVYLGSDDPNTKVDIVFLQSYGQPGKYISKVTTISPGRTTIVIPEIFNSDVEKGGAVMARVTQGRSDANIQVRLSGVNDIPNLNVNNLINDTSKEAEVKNEIRSYIKELKQYVYDLPNMYPTTVSPFDKLNNIYTYDPATSVLDSTDIEGDRFTLTFPASQILQGIEQGLNGNEDAQVERVYNALLAWEQEMQFAYAKKGVYEELKDFNGNGSIDEEDRKEFNNNKVSTLRMNIKYQRMMMGAGGYASSHHVGVPGGGAGFMQGVPYKFDANGKVTNPDEAKLYGDLIGHEIGHVLDAPGRVYDETSNNLFRELTKTIDDKDKSSLESGTYEKLYKKVTSHTKGLSTDRMVVLGMLWQLRLAYEDSYTSQMLITDNDNNPNNDSYFAKVNRAYRNLTEEEKKADRDQKLIMVSSRVAQKDLTDFFIAHGITPTTETYAYIAKNKWEKETRQIQYINDEARRQRLAGTNAMATDTEVVASFGVDKEGNKIKDGSYVNQKEVPLNLSVNKDSEKILGYEILRNGQPWGFVEAKGNKTIKYDDVVDTSNNRTFEYSIVAYDYLLNKTEEASLGTIKVRHDGSISKESLNLSTNTIDKIGDNDTHGDNEALKQAIDEKSDTVYEGRMMTKEEYDSMPTKVESLKPGTDPYVIIDTNSINAISGIKYTAPTTTGKIFRTKKLAKSAIQKYEIQVSKDGNIWTTVKNGSFDLTASNPTTTVYFDKDASGGGKQLATHNIRFIKLIAKGSSEISVAELDVIGPPGDNIEIGVSNDNINYKNGIGILKEDYIYQKDNPNTNENETKYIPKNSIIITGEYRGNPAFNVPLVLNQDEKHIANEYKGILLAEVPNNGKLEDVSEGNWIYWVAPEDSANFMTDNKEIFAELYRTDTADAQDSGQRLVSNTFKIDVPDRLPEISLSGINAKKATTQKAIEIDNKVLNKLQKSR